MERSVNRPLIVLLAMILGLTILLCLCYLTLFVQPNLPFNPLSPDRATAAAATRIAQIPTPAVTNTPVATYPPTWTPSPTFTPGPTKTPTDTRTPTPTSTSTPTATGTPTRTPTIVVPPTLTATPPYMYAGVSGNSENNCANVKLRYAVNGEDGEPVSGYLIEYGEIGVRGSVFQTERTEFHEFYGVTLLPGTDRANAQRSHNWFAYLIKDDEKISKASLFSTDPLYALDSERCDTNSNGNGNGNANANGNGNGNGNGNDNMGCIPDPCTSSGAVNVKEIIWQPRVTGFIPIGTSTPRPNLCRPPYEDFVIPRTCSDCATQADAQRLFELVGGPRVDIYDFDRDGNGLACEHLP